MPTPARGQKSILSAAFASLALRLQEAVAADQLTNSDVCSRLRDCLQDCARTSMRWCYYIDHIGDAESGDVIYSDGGDTMRAPYSFSTVGTKQACAIDMEAAIDVVPRTIYEEEVEDSDHYTAMESEKLYRSATEIPLYERFISKGERKDAPSGSFAGKGKSFPILKPADVMAAVKSMGRAGAENYDAGTLKRNIVKIAKAKGWEKELPKAWRDGGATTTESDPAAKPGGLKLVEASAFTVDVPLREAFKDGYKIKLISPGKGSTAYYTAEALKLAATDRIFHAGLPMRIDHPTAAEEAARPEGSVKDWGAVLAKDAYWLDQGPAGAGLYSEVKPFSDHAQTIEEKGPYAGVSICAYGEPLMENGKKVLREGLPVIARFTSADGADMVTRAGAGGMFLTEAAKPVNSTQEDSDMDAAELKKLQESVTAQSALNARLLERAIKGDAREEAVRILKPLTLAEAAKERVIEAVTRDFASIPQSDGVLDTVKFTEAVNAAAKTEGAYVASLIGSGHVFGMGATAPTPITTKETAEAAKERRERLLESRTRSFADMGMPLDAAKRAAMRDLGEVA